MQNRDTLVRGQRMLFLWLFGDFFYAILPILVLAVITALLGEKFHSFLLMKEWSFATIMLLGVSLRAFIRRKGQMQHTPYADRLYTGVQLYVVLLVSAVLVLSLVILGEKGVLPLGDAAFLGKVQVLLFATSAAAVLRHIRSEEGSFHWTGRQAGGMSRGGFLRRMNGELDLVDTAVERVLCGIEWGAARAFPVSEDIVREQLRAEKEAATLEATLERLERLVADARKGLQALRLGWARPESTSMPIFEGPTSTLSSVIENVDRSVRHRDTVSGNAFSVGD